MKRDMDTARQIILAAAKQPYGEPLNSVDGVSQEEFIMHVIWMHEAGLVIAEAQAGTGSMAKYAFVSRLTWDGCDFADAVIDDNLWRKAKTSVVMPGISFTFDVLKEWLKAEIKNGLPTLRGLSG